jgi:hypothetical protein
MRIASFYLQNDSFWRSRPIEVIMQMRMKSKGIKDRRHDHNIVTLFLNFLIERSYKTKTIKMKFLVVFALFIAAALAAPADVELLKSDFTNDPASGYSFAFEQSDGQKKDETGEVRNFGQENEFVAVRGSFTFTAPDGQTYTVNYVAGKKLFFVTVQKQLGIL